MTVNTKDLYGRYEKDSAFTNFVLLKNGEVHYSWGMVGFKSQFECKISVTNAAMYIADLLSNGYVKTEEIPLSEGNSKITDEFLDWVGGITR